MKKNSETYYLVPHDNFARRGCPSAYDALILTPRRRTPPGGESAHWRYGGTGFATPSPTHGVNSGQGGARSRGEQLITLHKVCFVSRMQCDE